MLNELSVEIYQDAVEHGWYDDGGSRNFGEVIALCHSELSEALEEWRNGITPTQVYYREKDQKPEGIAMEMADTIIRILDWAGAHGVDMDHVVREKMEFNKSRPYRHGGKVA